jgi:hypothetical protein
VHISNCHIVAGDDCIVLKSTEAYPCENVVVSNCTLETTCTAIKLGTESLGDFRDIHFSNCTVRNTRTGIGFYLKDGATMERVTFTGISLEAAFLPVFMDIERRYPDSAVGTIRDVVFRDIQVQCRDGLLIQGMPESPIENLAMQNVSVRVVDAADYAGRRKPKGSARNSPDDRDTIYAQQPSYVTLAHVRGLTLDNVCVVIAAADWDRYERSAVCCHDVEDGVLRGVRRQPAGREGQMPVLDLHGCRRVRVLD